MRHAGSPAVRIILGIALLACIALGAPAPARSDDELSPFGKLASTPSRLTMFNAHDDARQGAYNCSKEREVIEAALKQTRAFLTLHPTSDYSDNSLFHMVRIASQADNLRQQMEATQQLLEQFPTSDLADDALWFIASHVAVDSDMYDKATLLERLIGDYPTSGYMPRAMAALTDTYRQRGNLDAAVRVARAFANAFPHADGAPPALLGIADRLRDQGTFDGAIETYNEVLKRYPFSDQADDALFGIATCCRSQQAWGPAYDAYTQLMRQFPGSPHVAAAMRELNNRTPGQFDLNQEFPSAIAARMYQQAEELRGMRRFADAVSAYQQILISFRGTDCYDDSLFDIGRCFEQLDLLGMTLSQANGPEDRFSRLREWRDATGMGAVPEGEIRATGDAVSAYLMLANNFVGSPLRDDAYHRIQELFKERKMAEEEAMVCQELLLRFPGTEFQCDALHAVVAWYARKAPYPECLDCYKALSRAMPVLFPSEVGTSEQEFKAMMRFYASEVDLAYDEAEKRFIGYTYAPADLIDDAVYYIGDLDVSYGRTKEGAKMLSALLSRPQSDEAAFALFSLGRAYERLGDPAKATQIYQKLSTDYALSGLADDAAKCLSELTGETPPTDVSAYAQQAEALVGKPVSTYDVYVGDNVVVFCPFGYTGMMRAYNLPNIWDTAQGCLAEWTGEPERLATRQVIVMDTGPEATAGSVIRLPVSALGDPPQWDVGLSQLAQNFMDAPKMKLVREMGEPMLAGFVSVAAASLQYDLVSETRDTIGNASAVKLPFENLIRQRDEQLAALSTYEDGGADPDALTPGAAGGMLLSILDDTGTSKGLVDWSPFKRFFSAMDRFGPDIDRAASERDRTVLFVRCMNEAFNTDLTQAFMDWGFDIRPGDAREVASATR